MKIFVEDILVHLSDKSEQELPPNSVIRFEHEGANYKIRFDPTKECAIEIHKTSLVADEQIKIFPRAINNIKIQ